MAKVIVIGNVGSGLKAILHLLERELEGADALTIDGFILKLMSISEDKRKLPLVIQAPNGELFPPSIKMLKEESNPLFGKIEKMIITH